MGTEPYPAPDNDTGTYVPPTATVYPGAQHTGENTEPEHNRIPDKQPPKVTPIPVYLVKDVEPTEIVRAAMNSFYLDGTNTKNPFLLITQMPNRISLAIKNLGTGNLYLNLDQSGTIYGFKLSTGEGLITVATNAIWGYVDAALTVCMFWEYRVSFKPEPSRG